jgi:predicted GH43/DUF377 family glycosyl hydrolase
MNRNLCKKVINAGGSLTPLLISANDSTGLGLMNPSIYVDKENKLILNLRNVNYTLYHAENGQLFNNRYGCLAYLNPENDQHLRTTNWYCEINKSTDNKYYIEKYFKVDTSKLDVEPIWEFVGLEDARLVRWDDKLFMCGVRRDTTTNGQGRMELSEIIVNKTFVKEQKRFRIEPPNNPDSYCEKNWMPVIDQPYTFVKWCNPTEVVKVNTNTLTSKTIYSGTTIIPDIADLRGSSQVIPYKEWHIAVVHDVNLFKNKVQQKDATYMHRFIVWDKNWQIIKISELFSFMTGEVEFSCGMTLYNEDLLISFGFQDNAAYILSIPKEIIDDIIFK